jgi:hypothetical protein
MDYRNGDRVELHPGCDAWMQGDRYGEIVDLQEEYAAVLMDKSGQILRCSYDRLRKIS